MLAGKGRTSKTNWITTTFEDFRMEVRKNGFYCRITMYTGWIRFDMGHSGSFDKGCHFIPVKMTYSGAKLARIVCLHGVPKKIVSDTGSQLTSKFWEKLHQIMKTKLNFSSTYHPKTDGRTERTNQILEDMLRACALKYGKS
jgi:hypothetical protein